MTLDWTLETLLQIAGLGVLGALVPVVGYAFHGPGFRALAVNLVLSALVVYALAVALFAALYLGQGVPLSGAAVARFLVLGAQSAIVWLPVLLLTGLGLGQRSAARQSREREAREAAEHRATRT